MSIVTVTELKTNVDDRGCLTELIRIDDNDVETWGQTYLVSSYARGTIRGLHSHKHLIDHFTIIKGSCKYRFFAQAPNQYTGELEWQTETVFASDKKLTRVMVPPNVMHGWMSLEDDTILISTASVPYCGIGRNEPADEERIPYNYFDEQFGTWDVVFK